MDQDGLYALSLLLNYYFLNATGLWAHASATIMLSKFLTAPLEFIYKWMLSLSLSHFGLTAGNLYTAGNHYNYNIDYKVHASL